MSSKDHMVIVDALFGGWMTDPTLDERPGMESLVKKPYVSKSRRATIALPDLKTIIVAQDLTDIDDIRPLVLRSTREAIVEHRIDVSVDWKRRRTERVGLQIAHYGFGIDVDDFGQDPEVIEQICEELEIPPYMKLIGAYEVDDIPLFRPDNFHFLEDGGLVDESREQDLQARFTFLRECVLLSGTEPAISASIPRR